MRRAGVFVLVFLSAGAGIVYLLSNSQPRVVVNDSPPPKLPDRRPNLRAAIAKQESDSAKAIANYQPTIKAHLDNLSSPTADILRGLPGVVQVDVKVAANAPTHRIIHFRNWHFVPKESLSIELPQAHGRPLNGADLDQLYDEHLLEVELVQVEQIAVLRCLIKHHGLNQVFAEGFSPGELAGYNERIAGLRKMEQEQIPELKSQLADVRKLVQTATGDRKDQAKVIEADLISMLSDHKHRLLEMGAAGRLLIAGELEAVLPLEDDAAMQAAKPNLAGGKVQPDPQKLEMRHDAQVREVIKHGPVAVIILGGSHDLTESVRRHEGCEYILVTTSRFRELAN